jgi:hypothetical protein
LADWLRFEAVESEVDKEFEEAEKLNRWANEVESSLKTRGGIEPPGWKLVPIEPTEEMWTAGRDPILYRDMQFKVPECMKAPPWRINPDTGNVELDQSKGTTAVHVWRAMIAASPVGQDSAAPSGENGNG